MHFLPILQQMPTQQKQRSIWTKPAAGSAAFISNDKVVT